MKTILTMLLCSVVTVSAGVRERIDAYCGRIVADSEVTLVLQSNQVVIVSWNAEGCANPGSIGALPTLNAGQLADAIEARQSASEDGERWKQALTWVSNRTEQAQAALAGKAGDNDPRFDRSISLGGLATLTNIGTNYDGSAAAKSLGTAIVNLTGVVNIRIGVYHSKVGTGTITYELYNVTTASEAGSLTDAAGAGERVLSGVLTNTATGINQLRIRARSTVATDDPVYYGGSILLQ